MSKKDDLAKDLSRGRVRSLKKTINTTEESAARVVEKIAEPAQAVEEVVEEKTIRTTMDLPRSVHRAIKMKSAREGISLKDYIVSLVKSDLDLE